MFQCRPANGTATGTSWINTILTGPTATESSIFFTMIGGTYTRTPQQNILYKLNQIF